MTFLSLEFLTSGFVSSSRRSVLAWLAAWHLFTAAAHVAAASKAVIVWIGCGNCAELFGLLAAALAAGHSLHLLAYVRWTFETVACMQHHGSISSESARRTTCRARPPQGPREKDSTRTFFLQHLFKGRV